jgi:hypothetical protein
MSQPSEDRSPEATPSRQTARVLPFERSSELQRAVQQRAMESMERTREREMTKPNPVRRLAMFALALIPVGLLFGAVDGLLRVFHHMNDLYNSPDANPAPTVIEAPQLESSEPGVVLLQPPKNLDKPPAQPK